MMLLMLMGLKEGLGARGESEAVVGLLTGKPNGILHLLDEETAFPKGSDHGFLQALPIPLLYPSIPITVVWGFQQTHYSHAGSPAYVKPKAGSGEFGIVHGVGGPEPLFYAAPGFLDANRRPANGPIKKLLKLSQSSV